MCNWRQVSPREMMAPIRGTEDSIVEESKIIINALENFRIQELLELEKRKHRSLFLLLNEAVFDLLKKYPDRSQE